MRESGYVHHIDDFDENNPKTIVLHWPVAPGETWAPNFSINKIGSQAGYYQERDLVQVLIMPIIYKNIKIKNKHGQMQGKPIKQEPPYKFHISIWGADDEYFEVGWISSDERLAFKSLSSAKKFIDSMPNPLRKEWLYKNGHEIKV